MRCFDHRHRSAMENTRVNSNFSATMLSLEELVHCKSLWLDDGTVVLVAKNTAFKVYKGLLAAQSLVFSDMLSAGSTHATQILDGCPVVHLSDSPEDLRHLLRALISKEQIL